jgi:hypothetical protein
MFQAKIQRHIGAKRALDRLHDKREIKISQAGTPEAAGHENATSLLQ